MMFLFADDGRQDLARVQSHALNSLELDDLAVELQGLVRPSL